MKKIIFIIIILALAVLGYYATNYHKKEVDYLHQQIEELEREKKVLEMTLDDLEDELGIATRKINRLERNVEIQKTNYNLLKQEKENTDVRNENLWNYVGEKNNASLKNFSSIPTDNLTTVYKDGATVIAPTFTNLFYLFELGNSSFVNTMRNFNYVLTTNRDMYINNKTRTVYCTIDKEYNSVRMFFTEYTQNDIEKLMIDNGINFKYDSGYKVYTFQVSFVTYELYYKNDSNGLGLVLRSI